MKSLKCQPCNKGENKMQLYHFVVRQCVAGNWVMLIRVETENKVTSVGATKALDDFTDKLFSGGKMFMTKESESVIFNTDKWPISIEMIEGPIQR